MRTAIAMLIACFCITTVHGQSQGEIAGEWVSVHDTSEHLTLFANGDFKLVAHDVINSEYHKSSGRWVFNSGTKKKMFLFYTGSPAKQFLIVRRRGALGYTLNDMARKLVYGRRALHEGEPLPKIESAID